MYDSAMSYTRRIIDDLLDEVIGDLAAIALEGAKGVGKTATARQRARSELSMDVASQRALVAGNVCLIRNLEPPVLIDEWQLEPQVWDAVRRAVDDDRAGGQFLLTGSAGVAPGVRIHSGAGRIVSVRMRPLSLAERGIETPTVSLASLMNREGVEIGGHTTVGLAEYTDEILGSGFPGIRPLSERGQRIQLDSYVTRIVDRELVENEVEVRRPRALRAWLSAYAAATSTQAAYSNILDSATPGEGDKPTRQTAEVYREALTRLFVLDPLEAWIPAFSPLKRLTVTPKHHLVDPALAARLVGVGKRGLLTGEGDRVGTQTGTWLGALFESLATQSVRVYAEATEAQVGHLRTMGTAREIDLIVEGPDRSVVAIEVKLAGSVSDHDVRHLNWLHDQIGDRLADRVVLTTGEYAYRRSDGIAVVPLALLGP